jgi:(p)ppGpp synthase/HD superfamily hydrolase
LIPESHLERALVLATRLHAEQKRKGAGSPYVSHLLAVAALVMEFGGDEDAAVAALLHDAAEDQGGEATLDLIREEFGAQVADIVLACSDSLEDPPPPWRQRKLDYIAALPDKSPAARLVSMADKLHNVRAVMQDYRSHGEELWQRFNGRREGTLWYYRALAEAFAGSEPRALSEELERAVAELDRLVGEAP